MTGGPSTATATLLPAMDIRTVSVCDVLYHVVVRVHLVVTFETLERLVRAVVSINKPALRSPRIQIVTSGRYPVFLCDSEPETGRGS